MREELLTETTLTPGHDGDWLASLGRESFDGVDDVFCV